MTLLVKRPRADLERIRDLLVLAAGLAVSLLILYAVLQQVFGLFTLVGPLAVVALIPTFALVAYVTAKAVSGSP